MGDLKSRLNNARTKLLRRGSAASARSIASSVGSTEGPRKGSLHRSVSLTKLPEVSTADVAADNSEQLSQSAVLPETGDLFGTAAADNRAESSTSRDRHSQKNNTDVPTACPTVTLEEPSPIPLLTQPVLPQAVETPIETEDPSELPLLSATRPSSRPAPPGVIRRQSLVTNSNARIIRTLLEPDLPPFAAAGVDVGPPPASDYFSSSAGLAGMLHRKIWVKRPNSSATLVQIREDDLVDDVRDTILKKYANSLGKNFDPPDVTLRMCPRDSTAKSGDRILGPEEEMCRTLDAYYPGGQTINEALIIDVPQRRTPKPSPRVPLYYSHHDDSRPFENSSEYFPPMPIVNPSPATIMTSSHESRGSLPHAPHSIAVLQTGQLPPLPSPGSTRRLHHGRPKYPRHNTASPTTLTGVPSSVNAVRPANRPRHDSSASETKHSTTSGNAPIATPPAPTEQAVRQNSTSPIPRVASPRPDKKRRKPKAVEPPTLPAGLLDGSVPPINVLIVEDNIINLRVLGAFMQRLKVRWQRAMNGKEAVTKWRAGGFHLVLMDIQLPIMNGLEATKEIRRLERVNSIGVFSSGSSETPNSKLGDDGKNENVQGEDKLGDKNLFKSPVIIVALTASSLQSDRHEALAAGCNDFLTKPVNFVWLERKVKEWGCMQALIDFDGWRKWKDFAAPSDTTEGTSKISTSYSAIAPRARTNATLSPTAAANSMNGKSGPTAANGIISTPKTRDEEKKNKRKSTGVVPPPLVEEEGNSPTPPEADSSAS
ncbi:uncharacterized protein BDR25DRAFT_304444 [Lindgomyces ingoldianus]|uniref:Uncharacterized protein n=1 Tax=Lindgomyces ingoldianus TaxID=673940 RepID=A0ACB6QS07_9PLEO|nr:uncharacterized protein BDR25DRAFT_304444 [Lindgomyces ingoldianus]KAF2469300.1 hypothetical protein BDR25DRAFT_304444 [Lindgomyces ingoldianus]